MTKLLYRFKLYEKLYTFLLYLCIVIIIIEMNSVVSGRDCRKFNNLLKRSQKFFLLKRKINF